MTNYDRLIIDFDADSQIFYLICENIIIGQTLFGMSILLMLIFALIKCVYSY